MHTCLGIKIFQGDFLRRLFFIYNGGNLHFSFGFGGNFVSALIFFLLSSHCLCCRSYPSWRKGGAWGWGGELILQNWFFLNLSHFLIQLTGCASLYTFVPGFLSLNDIHYYHDFVFFWKAITYLQSAYRLKGEDIIEAHDITEIAGVWYYSC